VNPAMMNYDPMLLLLSTMLLTASIMAMAALVFALLAKRQVRQVRSEYEQRLALLEKQAKLSARGANGIGQRVVAVEKKLEVLKEKAEDVSDSEGALAYTQAMQLFEQGVDTDTIATSCGLSSAEANLMATLHRHKHRAA
jgi:hypothetical protein